MERRTFLKGAFGLTVLAVGAGAGMWSLQSVSGGAGRGALVHVTGEGVGAQAACGPLMQAGIQLFEDASGIAGYHGDTQLFTVDSAGAALISLADGSRDVESIAAEAGILLGCVFAPAEVASFFVTLGKAGYLQNEFYVNLVENPA